MAYPDECYEWLAEKDDFRFTVGSHSADERIVLEYRLKETRKVNPNNRCFFAEADVTK